MSEHKLNPPPRYDDVYFEGMAAIEAHDREHGYPAPKGEDLEAGQVGKHELPPLSLCALAHMNGEDHNYGMAWRERERQLSETLTELKALSSRCESLQEVVRMYRETRGPFDHHRGCRGPSSLIPSDDRCVCCRFADALLEPQPKPAEGETR